MSSATAPSKYPTWLDASRHTDYDEFLRERNYVFGVMQNPYSPNKEYVQEWMKKLSVMEADLRRTRVCGVSPDIELVGYDL